MRWIVYGALGIWLSGAPLDLLIGTMRVLYSTSELGRPSRPTWTYFASGLYTLLAIGTLAWLFYSDYTGEFWTIMIGCMVSLPEGAYVIWLIYSAPPSMEHDRPFTTAAFDTPSRTHHRRPR